MMSNESSPDPRIQARYLEEAIETAKRSARRGQTRFWLMSAAGVALVLTLMVLLLVIQKNVDSKLLEVKTALNNLEAALVVQKDKQAELADLQEKARVTLSELQDRQGAMKKELDSLVERNRQLIQREVPSKTAVGNDIDTDQLLTMGFQALEREDFKQAVRPLNSVILREPKRVEAYEAMGFALAKLERWKDSAEAYEKAFNLHNEADDFLYLYIEAARSWSGMDDHLNKALEMLDKAIAKRPTQWLTYRYRAFVNFLLGDDQKAEGDWKMSAKYTMDVKDKVGSEQSIALIYLRNGQWSKALNHTDEMEQRWPDKPWNLFFRWIAAEKLGRKKLAMESKQRWMKVRSKDFGSSLKRYLPPSLHKYLQV